jgi:predicted Zn-dependent protease
MYTKSGLAALLAGCILAVAGSASELPEIGASAGTVFSSAEEKALGESFARQLRQSAKVIDDPEIDAYLNGLGLQLAANSESPGQGFHFILLNEPSINAFAVPGGYIGIHSGLILHAQEEGELASVLAHEIAHVTQHHIARRLESEGKFSLPMVAATIAAILIGMKNPEIGQAALATMTAGNVQMQINFTRAHEHEADRVGMQILAGTGFDPRGMPAFFERMQSNSRYYEDGNFPEFLRTHPVTTDRIAESRERAETYPAISAKPSPLFYLMRAKTLVLTAAEPLRLARQLRQTLAEGNYRDERAVRYALALALLTGSVSKDVAEQLDWLRRQDGDRVSYRLLAARLATLEQQPERSLQLYREALQVYPKDTALSLAYAQMLLQQKQAGEAATVLLQLGTSPRPDYYRLLAQAQRESGATGESYLAMAEHYYLNGQTRLALEQLQQASKQPSLSFYVSSRIEARMKQLDEEVLAEQPEGHPGNSK